MRIKKIILAYSGGLDTSVIIKWLKEKYDCEIIAFTADIGQSLELEVIREKAIKTGASKIHIKDLKEEFANDFLFPMLRGNAFYENNYLLGTSISRPLIAKEQIHMAEEEHADGVSHGCTGKGNDQIRLELTYLTLNPGIQIIAPWRNWELNSRSALINYAEKHGIPIKASIEKPYSTDENLFHISYEGGVLEDPWKHPPEEMFQLTVSPERAPDAGCELEIDYELGDPVSINGKRLTPAEIFLQLNQLGGVNGIGRVDIVESRFVGMKSRGVYETPGGTILHFAHRSLESITLDREVIYLRDTQIPTYSKMIYNGFWFSPERKIMQKSIDESQKNVTGTVRIKLYKGNCILLGRKAEKSLYYEELASFEKEGDYRQDYAEGFIRLNALRLKLYSEVFGKKELE